MASAAAVERIAPTNIRKAPRASKPVRDLVQRVAPTDHLTPTQLSDLIQVPVATLAVWRCTNRVVLPFAKIGGHVRYRRADIDRFIAANMHNAEGCAA